jgi:hypothetical protein
MQCGEICPLSPLIPNLVGTATEGGWGGGGGEGGGSYIRIEIETLPPQVCENWRTIIVVQFFKG